MIKKSCDAEGGASDFPPKAGLSLKAVFSQLIGFN